MFTLRCRLKKGVVVRKPYHSGISTKPVLVPMPPLPAGLSAQSLAPNVCRNSLTQCHCRPRPISPHRDKHRQQPVQPVRLGSSRRQMHHAEKPNAAVDV